MQFIAIKHNRHLYIHIYVYVCIFVCVYESFYSIYSTASCSVLDETVMFTQVAHLQIYHPHPSIY